MKIKKDSFIYSVIILISWMSLSSCAFFRQTMRKEKMLSSSVKTNNFVLTDKSGKFNFIREAGFIKGKNEFVVKRKVIASDDPSKLLEKSIVISNPGKYNGVNLLRPKISQYSVWFDKKKYFTEMKISPKEKSLYVKTISPEKQWNGEAQIKFPKMTGVYCFFSQVLDCASFTGFIDEATKRQAGSMRMLIIWEGYPYFQEQYLNIPNEVFTEAVFEYDGKNRNNERRFTLKVAGQQIFYFIHKDNSFKKMFWIVQGLSIVPNNIPQK